MSVSVVVPEQIADRFASGWNARDAAALAELFADDADFVNVVGLWWENREDIRRAHDYGLRTFFRDSTASIRRTKVRELAEGLAVVHGGGVAKSSRVILPRPPGALSGSCGLELECEK